jgi:hypothetical protein
LLRHHCCFGSLLSHLANVAGCARGRPTSDAPSSASSDQVRGDRGGGSIDALSDSLFAL